MIHICVAFHMRIIWTSICWSYAAKYIWFSYDLPYIWDQYESFECIHCHDNLFIHHFKILCFSSNTMIFSLCFGLADETIKLSDDKDWNLRSVVNFRYTTHGQKSKYTQARSPRVKRVSHEIHVKYFMWFQVKRVLKYAPIYFTWILWVENVFKSCIFR